MQTSKAKTGTSAKKSEASKEMRNPNASKQEKSNAAKEMANSNNRGGKHTHH